jgi:hypothetical protein
MTEKHGQLANHSLWIEYNKGCQALVLTFLNKYYNDHYDNRQWRDEAEIFGEGLVYEMAPETHDFSGILSIQGRYFRIYFIKECLELNATLEDIYSFQDFSLDCHYKYKERGILLSEWIKHSTKRPKLEDCEDTATGLLYKIVPALEGITHYEEILEEIKGRFYERV